MSRTKGKSTRQLAERKTKRVFSLPEANRALVLVKRIVIDVIFEYSRMIELQEQLEAAEEAGSADQSEQTRLDLIRSAGRLRTCLDELDDVGVELKDWALGVVDFPSFAAGREVCLCWQYGQDSVAHWHEVGDSFAARQPVESMPRNAEFFQTAAGAKSDSGTDH